MLFIVTLRALGHVRYIDIFSLYLGCIPKHILTPPSLIIAAPGHVNLQVSIKLLWYQARKGKLTIINISTLGKRLSVKKHMLNSMSENIYGSQTLYHDT